MKRLQLVKPPSKFRTKKITTLVELLRSTRSSFSHVQEFEKAIELLEGSIKRETVIVGIAPLFNWDVDEVPLEVPTNEAYVNYERAFGILRRIFDRAIEFYKDRGEVSHITIYFQLLLIRELARIEPALPEVEPIDPNYRFIDKRGFLSEVEAKTIDILGDGIIFDYSAPIVHLS